jgi:hypothetical protein
MTMGLADAKAVAVEARCDGALLEGPDPPGGGGKAHFAHRHGPQSSLDASSDVPASPPSGALQVMTEASKNSEKTGSLHT